jgi:transcriptional regulator with XRE-family HTH domain
VKPQELFGANVKRERGRAGLSQEQLADRAGFHATEISRLERGVRDPRLDTIVRISRGLGVAPSVLFDGIR